MQTDENATATWTDFDSALEGFRRAITALVNGDPEPVTGFYSRRDDVTLANPLGPPHVGPAEVDKAIAEAAAPLRDGSVRSIEEVARYSTPDLAYVVEIERAQARLPGSENMERIALRVTMIFRREADGWKLVHRHADPITTPRPVTTVIET